MTTAKKMTLQRRLAETDAMIADLAKEVEREPDLGCSLGALEDTRCSIIAQIYEIDHPGMTLDEMGQPIPKPEPLRLRPRPERQKTPEDIEAEEWMTKTLTVLSDAKDRFKPGEGGTMPCPICGKSIQVHRARINGHVAAKCETADCVRFME